MNDHPESSCHPFLSAQLGDFVLVKECEYPFGKRSQSKYWVGRIIFIVTGPRNSNQNSLFQLIDLKSGYVQFVNADEVLHLFPAEPNTC